MIDTFDLGNPKVNERHPTCCGKPIGCNMTHEGCAYLRHPWKRAVLYGDSDIRRVATTVRDGEQLQCTLLNTHAGSHEI